MSEKYGSLEEDNFKEKTKFYKYFNFLFAAKWSHPMIISIRREILYILNRLLRRLIRWLKQPLERLLFSMIKIIVSFFILLCLFSLFWSICFSYDGIVIFPFQTPSNLDYDGQALANLLIHELTEINKINRIGIGENSHFGMYTSELRETKYYIPQPIIPQAMTFESKLYSAGRLGNGLISVSIGDIYLSLRHLLPFAKISSLYGSLQVYDRKKVILIACLYNKSSISTWKILSKDNGCSREIPMLIQELAYQIACSLSFKKMGSSYSWQAYANFTKGLEAYQIYQYTGDLVYLEQARKMALNVNESEPHYEGLSTLMSIVALEYSRLNDSRNATAASEEATGMAPKNADVWINKGNVFARLGDYSNPSAKNGYYSNAADAYEKAISLEPRNANIWINKGIVLNSMGKRDEAIRAYDEAINLSIEFWKNFQLIEAWNHKGNSLKAEGTELANNGKCIEAIEKYWDAIDAYNNAIRSDPVPESSAITAWAWNGKGVALYDIGFIFYNKGNYSESIKALKEAIKAFKKAQEIDPNNPEAPVHRLNASSNLATAFNRNGEPEKANQAYNEVVKLNPKLVFNETAPINGWPDFSPSQAPKCPLD